MKNINIDGKNGYPIPVKENLTGNEEKVIVLSHGLGSSKSSPTATDLMAAVDRCRGNGIAIGAVAYDFPCSGESPVYGDQFRIQNCKSDLMAVEEYATSIAPEAEICYFSSSFGAYITLLRLSEHPHPERKAFLRSTAVNMPELFIPRLEKGKTELEKQGYFTVDEGFFRPLRICGDFLKDLDENHLNEKFSPGCADIFMIHGEKDEVVPLEKAKSFAEKHSIPFSVVPEGDHRLISPDSNFNVEDIALKFFVE